MYTKTSKKLIIMNILEILQKYSDENHRLSQKDISDILKNEYEIDVERKTVRSNLISLIEGGFDIEYSETIRMIPMKDTVTKKEIIDNKTGQKKMEETYIWSDFYLERKFTDGELRLLIDGLFSSRNIPYNQCKELIIKLENLSNVYFKSGIKHVSRMDDNKTDNKDIFLNIELLDEAISKKRKVRFKYIEYGTDKKVHTKKKADGTERIYIINPYQMVSKEGKYYLICNYDKYDDISNYRIDRIKDIEILEESVKPYEQLKWADGKYFDINQYMNEHIYMYSSGSVRVKMKINRPMITDIIDIFGKDVRFLDEKETGVNVIFKTNEASIIQFAKRYAPDVEILEPMEVRKKVAEELKRGYERYSK